MKESFGIIIFSAAVAFIAFLAGATVMVFRVGPARSIYETLDTARMLLADEGDASVNDMHQLYPARYDEAGVTTYDPNRAQDGVTLVTGYRWQNDRWQAGIRLIDMQGSVLHQWTVKPEEIWPESPFTDHVAGQMNNPNNYVHGAWLLPGGDVVFNVEYAGMVRMDACSKVVWTVPYRTHHSIFRDSDGNFWAPGLNWRYKKNPDYVHPQPEFVDETMLQVSPDGEILREIFVLKSIYDSGYGGVFADTRKTMDITHMNDVEILDARMADKFELFDAGDILVSLRNLSTVLVIDGKTEQIKWRLQYPLVKQHDPDFEPDGSIVIFDNRDDMTQEGMRLGSTRLLRVKPDTGELSTVYPITDEQAFYTQTGGKHQLLENGNRLITEAHGGRVFEIDESGDVVWNWIVETRGDGLVPEVLEGTRYATELADFETAGCATN
ncbi:MAG: arylsulfotransferase family protein [Gammaproteobacteria bacterium]